MKIVTPALIVLVLSGCSAFSSKDIQYVNKVVREPCIEPDKVPVRPTYQYGKGPKPDEKTRGLLLIKDFEAAEQYGTQWEAAATGCVKFVP